MSKALFFNALPDESSATGYDRNYNADDLSDFLSIVCDTGVVKTNNDASGNPQGLKVSSPSGRTVNVVAGKAVIRGKAFINEATASFEVEVNGTTSTRYDYIVLRYDNNISVRNITLELVKGTSTPPTSATNEVRVKELVLAVVSIAPSADTVTVADKRGDATLCPWFTAVKGYDDYYDAIVQRHESTNVLASLTNTVVTDLPSALYNAKYSLVEVYTNGIKELESAFTASVSGGYIVITFTAQKAAQTSVTVVLSNFIDGEGMTTALAQYTQFVQDVTALKAANEINYVCSGTNDNIAISNLVKANLNDSASYGVVRVNVIGNIGVQTPISGTGVVSNPYSWFDFETESTRKVVLDFSRAKMVSPSITGGTYNYLIHTTSNISVYGLSFFVYNTKADTVARAFSPTCVIDEVVNSTFFIVGYKDCYVATNGTFTNCQADITNQINNSYCFENRNILRINGGMYKAYTADSARYSAVVGNIVDNTVCILNGVSAPTKASTGRQTHAVFQRAGYVNCRDLISALPLDVISGQSTVSGTIPLSK